MDIIQQLKRDEGCRLSPYPDTVGKLTIGVGRNLTDNGIRQSEADLMLSNDIAEVEHDISVELMWTNKLDEARMGVLINMAFNIGFHGLVSFHRMLTFIEDGDYNSAADAMLSSVWKSEVGDRAKRLAEQLRTGVWQ